MPTRHLNRILVLGGPLLCSCFGQPTNTTGIYSVLLGPGFAPDDGGDGVGWDGVSVVPAELFEKLARAGSDLQPEHVADLYETYDTHTTASPWAAMRWCFDDTCSNMNLTQATSDGPWIVWGHAGENGVDYLFDEYQVTTTMYEEDSPAEGDLFASFTWDVDVAYDPKARAMVDTAYPTGGYPLYVGDQTNYQVLYANFWITWAD